MNNNILKGVGNTPLIQMDIEDNPGINLYAKLEFYNPTGSIKDRAANYIIQKLLGLGEINRDTTLVESSSGNFGIALSSYCREYGLKFYCVVDPHITYTNEMLINTLSTSVFKVTEPDSSGGYLLNRIKKVKELVGSIENSYWVNQYANPYNAEAYYTTLGNEICDEMGRIDYIFIGVSSGGTITGVSQKLKERFPEVKVIAVDISGSVIFGGCSKQRYIPGIGSSMVPDIIQYAKIDEVVTVDEFDTIKYCRELLSKYSIFAGGSSGSVFSAIHKYFKDKKLSGRPNVVTIFPDRGDRYSNTIYSNEWCDNLFYAKSPKNMKIK